MNDTELRLLNLIKYAIWGTGACDADEAVFEEARRHAVEALPADVLSQLDLPDTLKRHWELAIYKQYSYVAKYNHAQEKLPITVPYVILKGSAAAQYYPNPEYRAMGDIDIMTRREDFETACEQLLAAGFQEESDMDIIRHRGFKKGIICVENHIYFASLNDPKQAQYLDDLIIENINESHFLPDLVNGLVLLEHISQHLEHGLGLRQIIDWMMFVDKCLPDEKWPEFAPMAAKIGLKNLAIVVARMCEIYLGLPERQWCSSADESLCGQLMDYVLASGNFGKKRNGEEKTGENVFASVTTPKATVRLLQERGLVNWPAAQKYRFLRPFAWIYQAFRYLKRGFGRENAPEKLRSEYGAAKQKIALFDALGVKTSAKGLIIYKNGKYVKKRVWHSDSD